MVKVASASLLVPTITPPSLFFRSIIQLFLIGPPFFKVMLKLYTADTFVSNGLASPREMYYSIMANTSSDLRPLFVDY